MNLAPLGSATGIARATEHASRLGGKFLTNVWINTQTKYDWACSDGHGWSATYYSVVSGRFKSWCPTCADKKKSLKRRKPEVVAWKEFDDKLLLNWPPGSLRVAGPYRSSKTMLSVFCGGCQRCHRTNFNRVVTSNNGPRCSSGTRISHGLLGKPKTSMWLSRGESGFNKLLAILRSNARSRKLDYSLDRDYVRALVLDDCFWCDGSPADVGKFVSLDRKVITPAAAKHSEFGPCIGIDRMDNSVGYVPGNVVPCCHDCNWAKSNLSLAAWLALLSRLRRSSLITPGKCEKYMLEVDGVGRAELSRGTSRSPRPGQRTACSVII